MIYFKYINFPEIPDNLLGHDVDYFANKINIFRHPSYSHYKQYEVDDKLKEYLREIFTFEFHCSYQIITNGLAIHKDGDRTECLNYLIDTGGNLSELRIYDENKSDILHSEIILNKKWHWINVGMNHNVVNITGTRISISINPYKTTFI
jgi:hypothetical protein